MAPDRRPLFVAIAGSVVVAIVVLALIRLVGDDDGSGAKERPPRSTTTSAPAGSVTGVKPLVGGLMTRNGVPGRARADAISAWVVNVDWRELQPQPQGAIVHPNPIDRAIEQARRRSRPDRPAVVKVRVFTGVRAPDWAKRLDGAPLRVTDPQSGTVGAVGRFWLPAYGAAYDDLQRKLAAEYDDVPEIAETTAARCTTIFSEPFIRGVRDEQTVQALLDAGFTFEADDRCQREQIDAHGVWEHTRTTVSFNEYQHIRPDGSTFPDLAFSREMMEYCREVLGERCVLQNNSARWPVQSQELYDALAAVGPPLEFQTATMARVGDLPRAIEACIELDASAIELPANDDLTDEQLATYDAQLRANAERVDASE